MINLVFFRDTPPQSGNQAADTTNRNSQLMVLMQINMSILVLIYYSKIQFEIGLQQITKPVHIISQFYVSDRIIFQISIWVPPMKLLCFTIKQVI